MHASVHERRLKIERSECFFPLRMAKIAAEIQEKLKTTSRVLANATRKTLVGQPDIFYQEPI